MSARSTSARNAQINLIHQKRFSLRQQLDILTEALNSDTINANQAKRRLDRLTTLLAAYEASHDELATLDPANEGLNQLIEIQNDYYNISDKVDAMQASGTSGNSTPVNNLVGQPTIIEKSRSHKLPIPELPTFHGDYDAWVSFSNEFTTLVDKAKGIDDVDRLLQLKNCVRGRAKKMIEHLISLPENYKVAWKLLKDCYEKKRIVISTHLNALYDMTTPPKVTTESLLDIVNTIRQNLASLKNFDVEFDERCVVVLAERILPNSIREEWEKTVDLDEVPSLDKFYRFIDSIVFRLEAMKKVSTSSKHESNNKRKGDHFGSQNSKSRKNEKGERAFATSYSHSCGHCDQTHPTYCCPTFRSLGIQARWDIVKDKKLCPNCLRKHQSKCTSESRCKVCGKAHHTMLHSHSKNKSKKGNHKTSKPNGSGQGSM